MTAPYTGGCVCGAVTLAIAGEPVATRQCWCRQCQQLAAGGPTNNAIFKAEDVAIDGDLAASAWQAASGNRLTFHFCPRCGTQIFAQSSARPHLKTMRLGALDAGHGLKPDAVIWTEDAPQWAMIDPALEQWPRQPPPPPGVDPR
ncbi:GFA family protein [Sphingomonas sp. IC081]|uniref:GFA family protein n=1 Tax=Sphingomonas sp. IC081 TaxID=304378 RepID=UPI00115ABA33|nr:GFA family protein [Sphingomonas sp. IC081]QDK32491.1 aldehyde-activating protein [Sphingomonas sp. IC081]